MGNIINDIIDDINIEIKPNRTKIIIKWVIRISISLIILAFILGQINTTFLNRVNVFESNINKNTIEINDLKKNVDFRFNKIYDDGAIIINEFQEHNNTRLGLLIDYHDTDKEFLKRVLNISSTEETKKIINYIEKLKNDTVVGK